VKKIVPVYPWPMHARVVAAFEEWEDVTPVEALAGGPGPVVALNKNPPFVCDAIVVRSPDSLRAGVDIAIGNGLEMVTVRDMVSAAFGQPVTEKIERLR
jgi:hypothetical protein